MTKGESAIRNPRSAIIWLLFAAAIVVVFFAGLTIPLVGPDEPRYAQVAREMFERHDWITAALRLMKGEIVNRPLLSSWKAILEYCRASMAFHDKEQFRILFLDKKNQLIADEVQQVGTVDHTPVYTREVMKRALELSASAIILAHNHPSGDPTPSIADIDMTRKIIDAGLKLGITVHDHVIVGRSGHTSFRASQLI